MFGAARISEVAQYFDAFSYKAILLSAGGNDLISQIGNLLTGSGNSAALDDVKLKDAFRKVETLLRTFAYARVGTRNAETRIFIHAYDFVTPRNAPVRHKIAGPWVYPRLMAAGVTDKAAQLRLVTELLTRWMDRLTQLALPDSPKYIPGFHVLLTQGLLKPANANDTARSGDWEDAIHPTNAGYRVIAERLYNPVLLAVLDGA